MILKNKEIEIPPDNTFENDVLNRKEIIENLSMLVLKTNDPFVLSINGSWGTGKTTFVKFWKSHLETKYSLKSIYFSAWEEDFSGEPLFSLFGEVNLFLKGLVHNDTDKSKMMKVEKFKEVGSKVMRKAFPAFIKGAFAGFLNIDRGFEAAFSALSEEAAKELIEHYEKEKSLRNEFKNALAGVLELLPDNKPLIVFIDELDRCRPLYAIELLEKIKHFFGINRVIFILSIDKTQLSESIKSQYGAIDTENYLRRFIDLQFTLENPDIESFCDYLDKKFGFDKAIEEKKIQLDIPKTDTFQYLGMIKLMAKAFNLSLREIEQLFLKLHIVFKTVEPKFYSLHFRIFVIFEILRMRDEQIYKGVIKNEPIAKEHAKNIFNTKLKKFSDLNIYRNILILIDAVIDASGLTDAEYSSLLKNKQKELEKIFDKDSLEYKRVNSYINLLKHTIDKYCEYTLNEQINTVIKKLEFADKFSIYIESRFDAKVQISKSL